MAVFGSKKEERLQAAFKKIRDEFDDHLEEINANAQEIYENRLMIEEMNERLCKIADSISELQSNLGQQSLVEPVPEPIELNLREQEVFLAIYTSDLPLSYSQLGTRVSLPIGLIQELVFTLIHKGVPIIKSRNPQGLLMLQLDLEFRELQSKHNLVGINQNLSRQITREQQSVLVQTRL